MTFTIESQLMAKSLTVIRQIVSDFVFFIRLPQGGSFDKKSEQKKPPYR